MVYFNCGSCGTGLKKNQVEQHTFSCNSRVFSCIDCGKDFKNAEYKAHIKCITESEKYESKSTYVSKPNKGELKQNAWFDKVIQAVATFRGSARSKQVLEKLTDFPNVPRKKVKFFNFMRNSFRSYGVSDAQLEEIWSVIESFDKVNNNNATNEAANFGNGGASSDDLKRKLTDDTISASEIKKLNTNGSSSSSSQIQPETSDIDAGLDWVELIKSQCVKSPSNELCLKKLQKKLFKKYKKMYSPETTTTISSTNDDGDDNHELFSKFTKKLNKKLKKHHISFKLTSRRANGEEEENVFVQYIND